MRIMLTRRPRPWVLAPAVASLVASSLALSSLHAQNAVPASNNASTNPYSKVSKWTPPPLPAGKKPITQDTYDEWRGISGSTLSADGKWAVYTVSPVVGEGELIVRSTSSATEYRVPRGYTGRPQLQAGAQGGGFTVQAAQVSPDNKYVAFLIYPTKAEVEGARVRRGAPQPRTTLGIMNLADGAVTKIPSVRSFRMGTDGGQYIAYQLEDSTTGANAAGAGRGGRGAAGGAAPAAGGARDTTRAAGPRRTYGNDVVLRNLATGTETKIAGVTNFIFDEAGKTFAYSVTTRDSVNNGVFVRNLADGTVSTLISGIANYRGLGFNRAGNQVLFASDVGDTTKSPRYAVYHASLVPAKGKAIAARRVVSSAEAPAGMLVSESGRLEFTREGNAIVFSLGFVPQDSIPADSLTDKAVYDLWHWKEPTIQTQQRLSAGRDRNRTHLAVYHLATNKWTRLGNDSLAQVTLSDDGKRALALNSLEYAIEQFWGEGGADVYLIDATSGSRTPIRKKLRRGAQLSTGGNFVTWFDENHWYAYNIATGKTVDLTRGISNINFHDEEFDSPDVPPPYGIAGWTSGDKRVLINDRFDVWEVDPMGVAAPRNVTDGEGRKLGMTFRVVNLDREERFLDPTKPLMLRAVDSLTKASGFWRDKLGVDAKPERILMADKNFGGLQKAKDAEQYLLTQSTYREYPDLWTGNSLTSLTKISNANPQDSQYPRGTVELVSWYNSDGIPLRGLLYKPENFDPAKQYPMVVYFYEKLTDGLHNYVSPTGRNVVNPMVYNAQGYLVFEPDIVYTDGYPGPSAEKAIVPGVQSLIAKGFVDPKRIGITGQSWGGYQSAFLITRTNMFAAAVPNATVVNMTSAYGGIRWASGLARAFQYEHTQSRIGGSLWEYPERYIENSPLFHLDKVTTPVLFMANDNDGAVPWYQGIEFYVAMRRLQKEAYMLVYNGDEHNPTKRANQKDIDKKMLEFFAVKLQGAEAPDWMKKGIPFLEKGRDQIRTTTPATGVITPQGGSNN
jgi:dienelactone hydrolase